jgi:excisionase family DNA binding protein
VTGGARTARERWVGLGEASAMLGITPGTLRRWADEGRLPVFTTPGGHRRFSHSSLLAMLPAKRPHRPTLARLGASPERIARAYRARRPAKATRDAQAPWIESLPPDIRSSFRDRGRELVAALLDHLDATDEQAAAERLTEAKRLAASHGREVAGLGLSLTDAVEGFLRFRSPFTEALGSLARRRGLDTAQATALLNQAELATDALLVAVMTGHSLATAERVAGPDHLHDAPATP